MQLDEAFEIEKWPEDEFDIHASAFETALMQDICPDMDKVYEAYAKSLFENFYGERK